MFWRFGFHNPSAVDTLLEREDVTLEAILEEEELLQEAKSHNQKLINFLCQPANCEKLLYYITADDLEEGQKFKYPFLCSEIIACEIPPLIDMIILEQKELLETFWLFLDRPIRQRHQAKEGKQRKKESKQNEEGEKQEEQKEEEEEEEIDQGLESLLSSYFAKTITVFLTKQPAEMLEFIESKPENLTKILNHLQSSAIMDLLLTLVRMEELAEGKGIVQWLSDGGLMDNLINRLDPYLDTEEHSIAQQCICEIIRMSQTSLLEQPSIGLNDLIIKLKSESVMRKLAGYMLDPKAPNATSTLINGVTIIIDLIRHNNSDMENDPMIGNTYGYTGNNAMARQTPVSLAEMLKVLADHVVYFNQLLTEPRSVTGPMRTSIGEQTPLGFERLKICELFAELLHCSNMSNLNAVEENDEILQQETSQSEKDVVNEANNNDDEYAPTAATATTTITTTTTSPDLQAETTNDEAVIHGSSSSVSDHDNEKSLSITTEKTQEADNTKNTVASTTTATAAPSLEMDEETQKDLPMGDYLKLQLVQHKVLPTCTNLFFNFPWNNFLHYVTYDMLHQVFNGRMDKGYNRLLALSILKDGQLTTKMVNAQKKNDEEWAKPKGMRLGYMGHLTFIADEVIKLFEGYPEAIVQDIKGDVDLDVWYQYCENELRETKERDCLPLGGDRPNDDEAAMREEDDEEDELDGATANQYSRYLAQREAEGGLEDDEDDAHWITGRNDNIYNNAFGVMGDGHNQVSGIDDEAEYDSDEDEHANQVITQDWSRGFTEFPQANMLRRTQSHIEDGYDEGEGGEYDHLTDANEAAVRQQQRNMLGPNLNHSNDQDDEDEDPFGEFASGDNLIQGDRDDDDDDDAAWAVSTTMEQMNISSDNNDKSTIVKDTAFGNNFGSHLIAAPTTAATTTSTAATSTFSTRTTTASTGTSPISEDHYVRAIRTKEEDEKYKKEYVPGHDEEQEGEI